MKYVKLAGLVVCSVFGFSQLVLGSQGQAAGLGQEISIFRKVKPCEDLTKAKEYNKYSIMQDGHGNLFLKHREAEHLLSLEAMKQIVETKMDFDGDTGEKNLWCSLDDYASARKNKILLTMNGEDVKKLTTVFQQKNSEHAQQQQKAQHKAAEKHAKKQKQAKQKAEQEAKGKEAEKQVERERIAEEQARIAQKKAEEELAKKARIEAEKKVEVARIKAEEERIAKEQEQAEKDRIAEAARIEAERIAQEEADRKEQNRIAAEKKAEEERIEQDRIMQEQAEKNRVAEAERLAQEQAEKDRKAEEEAARIEAERIAEEKRAVEAAEKKAALAEEQEKQEKVKDRLRDIPLAENYVNCKIKIYDDVKNLPSLPFSSTLCVFDNGSANLVFKESKDGAMQRERLSKEQRKAILGEWYQKKSVDQKVHFEMEKKIFVIEEVTKIDAEPAKITESAPWYKQKMLLAKLGVVGGLLGFWLYHGLSVGDVFSAIPELPIIATIVKFLSSMRK